VVIQLANRIQRIRGGKLGDPTGSHCESDGLKDEEKYSRSNA